MVTGAGRGIGRAIAEAFASEGAKVIANDLVEATDTVACITQQGSWAQSLPADVSDPEQVQWLVATAVERMGSLDIVVPNAAYSERGVFYEQPLPAARKTVEVTLWGAYYTVRYAAAWMVRQQIPGNIVVISSPHAVVAAPSAMAYNMAKAGVDQMARTAAAELISHRIRVNIVHPGWVNTPGERRFYTDEEIAERGAYLPWGRLADPAEIARAVLFFADPASEYINGTTLTIDSGLRLPRSSKL